MCKKFKVHLTFKKKGKKIKKTLCVLLRELKKKIKKSKFGKSKFGGEVPKKGIFGRTTGWMKEHKKKTAAIILIPALIAGAIVAAPLLAGGAAVAGGAAAVGGATATGGAIVATEVGIAGASSVAAGMSATALAAGGATTAAATTLASTGPLLLAGSAGLSTVEHALHSAKSVTDAGQKMIHIEHAATELNKTSTTLGKAGKLLSNGASTLGGALEKTVQVTNDISAITIAAQQVHGLIPPKTIEDAEQNAQAAAAAFGKNNKFGKIKSRQIKKTQAMNILKKFYRKNCKN